MQLNIQRLWSIILVAFVLVLPFGPALPNILSAVLLGFALYQITRGKFSLNRRDWKHFIWMNAFILFLFISLLWSSNLDYGLSKLILLGFIPLFFLAISSSKRYLKEQILVKIAEAFLLAMTTLLVLSFIAAVSKNGFTLNSITENNLSTALIDFHFLGFSLYLSWAMILGLHVYVVNKEKISRPFLLIWPWCLVIMGGGLLLLSSRTTILITLVAIFCGLLLYRSKISRKAFSAVLLMTVLGGVFLFGINTVFKEKMKDAVNYENKYDVQDHWGGRGFRELIWNCANYLFEQNPIVGVGIGDQQDEMELCYRKYRYQQLLFKGNTFNTHNLFLQILVASGAIGLTLFLLAFIYPSVIAIKRKYWLYLSFVLLILGTGLTESHFNRNAIVSLFAFFNPIVFYLAIGDESTSDTQ